MCDSKLANIWTILGFGMFLLLGIGIYQDYGISWDEVFHRYMGGVSAFYVNELIGIIPTRDILQLEGGFDGRPPDLEDFIYKDYGAFFEMILAAGEYLFGLTGSREVFQFRHLFTFGIFFVGLIFFYLLGMRVFRNRAFAIAGCLMLIAMPRVFAHGFYDLKDIAPVTLVIVSIYTLVRLLDEKTIPLALLHAISIALFIDTRVIGIFLPPITIFFLVGAGAVNFWRYGHWGKTPPLIGLFLIALAFFIYLFWPYLWEDPIGRLWGAITNMGRYGGENDYDVAMVYFGHYIWASDVPWHYLPVWIGITTPVAYLILIVVGTGLAVLLLLKRPWEIFSRPQGQLNGILLLTAFGPIIAVIAVGSTLLDGWRHMYFCYPPMVMLGILGLRFLMTSLPGGVPNSVGRILRYGAPLMLVTSVGLTSANMYQNHPHQYAYFNILAGHDIAKTWELDYWGSSFKQGLEHVATIDDADKISVGVSSSPGKTNLMMLTVEDQTRFTIADEGDSDYFLSNYRFKKEYERFHAGEAPYDQEIFSIKVKTWLDEFKIMGVYKLR